MRSFRTFHYSFCHEQAGMQDLLTVFVKKPRKYHQVGRAGFIFQGNKANALGCYRSLPDQN
jgi:hypothetical protein